MGFRVVLFILIVTTTNIFCYADSTEKLVNTPSGNLKGTILKTWTDNNFFAFRGVPFAEPPIGKLRFEAPVSVKRWDGVKDATKDGKICLQNFEAVGDADEDCLFLNVYTKKLHGDQPVIVYFHPGAFYSMTGASHWSGPEYLLDHDIVLVTVNYRLDALGFLSTGDSLISGNNGLKDQVEALKWVQKHIKSFGGNPNKVTIAGYSAGSTSGFLHMLSPMSKGLFHNVIAMSSGVTSSWVVNKTPLKNAEELSGLLNCSTETTYKMIECLRQVPAKEINNKFDEMRALGVVVPKFTFGPVIEPDLGKGKERFLIDDPVSLIKRKEFHHVPVVTGITEYEFLSWSHYVLNNETTRNTLVSNFDSLAPSIFGYEDKSKQEAERITKTFKNFYFGNKSLSQDSVYELGQWFSDYTIIYGEYGTAKLLLKYNTKPVYFYKLTYSGRYSFLTDKETNKTLGAIHHDDLIYLLYNSKVFPKLKESNPEAFMVKIETSFWRNFATNGNPTPDGSPVQWTPLSDNNIKYLNFGSKLTMEKGFPFPNRMDLWESLFPVE